MTTIRSASITVERRCAIVITAPRVDRSRITAWEYVRQGESKHQALELTLRTLRTLHKVVATGRTGPA